MSDPTLGGHPAVAVKVPDNQNEHPQEGINEADIVFVQADGYRNPNGYDGTRLMPVYHSNMAENSAPVRSLRPVDVPLLAPMHAVLGSSGGAPWVVNYLESFSESISSDLVYIDMKGTGAYSVNRERVRKYQGQTYYDRALVCHPGILAEVSGVFPDGPPIAYLPFATDVDEPSIAKGTFVYASGGRHVRGNWSKRAEDSAFVFTLDGGAPLLMTPGRTFFELVDEGTEVTIS